MIKAHTDLNEKTIKQMNNYLFMKILIRILILNIVYIPLVVVSCVVLKDPGIIKLTIICSVIIGVVDIIFVVLYFVTQSRAKKVNEMQASYDFDFDTDSFSVVISKQGLSHTVKEDYTNIRRVAETKKLIMLQKNQNQYYAVAKENMSDTDLILLRSCLRAKIRGRLKDSSKIKNNENKNDK